MDFLRWGGAHVAVDTTLVSRLMSAAAPRRRSEATAGAARADARRSTERTYPEFGRASRCRLVVLGIEVGGRWSAEAANFVRLLARASTHCPPSAACHHRCLRWAMVGVVGG